MKSNQVIKELQHTLDVNAQFSQRLNLLEANKRVNNVLVYGKYNHGKSSLLNALIDENNMFSVADKRETMALKEYEKEGVNWIDSPGLDADIEGFDDALAGEALATKADIILLTHSVSVGELDAREVAQFNVIYNKFKRYREVRLVLTQIDELEKIELAKVKKHIKDQVPGLKIIEVSAKRYMRGLNEEKSVFVKKSGISDLRAVVHHCNETLLSLQSAEKNYLNNKKTNLENTVEILLQHFAKQGEEIQKEKRDVKKEINRRVNKIAFTYAECQAL